MRKNFLIAFLIVLLNHTLSFAEIDWIELYENSNPFESKLMNNIDPFQDEDTIKYAYSPYPLFRTSVYLYYKNITIPSGYYQLTPRKMNGNYYIFFKTNGRVAFIIPVIKREIVPENFYKKYMPEPKRTLGQNIAKNWKRFWSRIFKGSGKQPPPNSFVELNIHETCYVLKLYYKNHCYYTVYKKVPY
ncbi:hypothetical protein IJG14_07605 [bacterium]|nr:hypothetical protein [bacterium]